MHLSALVHRRLPLSLHGNQLLSTIMKIARRMPGANTSGMRLGTWASTEPYAVPCVRRLAWFSDGIPMSPRPGMAAKVFRVNWVSSLVADSCPTCEHHVPDTTHRRPPSRLPTASRMGPGHSKLADKQTFRQ